MAGSAVLELTLGGHRKGYEVVGDLVFARRKEGGRERGADEGKKEKERRRWSPGGGRHGSECAVVSEEEEERKGRKQPTAGERATNKLPGRSQRQVKQRRRG